jgi:predicted DNA-binding transcriptional regulator YafY
MPASDQLERVLFILPAAARDEGATLDGLARELGGDVATILDDVEQVTARAYYQPAGSVDPFTILIDSERIQVDAPFEFTRPVRLSEREALALGLGLRALALEQGERRREQLCELAERLERDLSVPEINLQPRLTTSAQISEAVPGEINIELGTDDFRGIIASAIEERRICQVSYLKSGDAAPADRRLAPHRLVYARGGWYVVADDVDRESTRLFRLDRVLRVELTDEHFEPVDVSEIVEQIAVEREAFVAEDGDDEVTVRYSPRIARWIADQEVVQDCGDGGVRVRHRVSDPRWLVRHVLRYAGEAVVETAPYRQLVKRAVRRLIPESRERPLPPPGNGLESVARCRRDGRARAHSLGMVGARTLG